MKLPNTHVSSLMSCLGAFAKLRKATISFVTSVHLSFRMKHLSFHWTNFEEI